MDENNFEKAEKAINALANLTEKLEKFPYALHVIYIVAGAVICSFFYFFIKMIIEFFKDRKIERLLEENYKIIGRCTEVMNRVCDKLEDL